MSTQKITVQEIKDTIQRLAVVRDEIDKRTDDMKPFTEEKESLQAKLTLMLKEIGEDSFKSEFGTISKITNLTVKLPKGEDREEFFNYLRERGSFESLVTIDYQTLNAYYREQREQAIENGDAIAALNFSLPGIGQANSFETIRFLRKK